MNNRFKLIGVLLLIGVISSQAYYFTTAYPASKWKIREVSSQIATKEQLLEQMENGLKRLPQMKQEVENTKLEVVALLRRIPAYTSIAKDLSDMTRMLETSDFTNVQINQGQVIEHVYEGHKFIERQYMLSYTSPFSDSKTFVENLNNAYQLINISSFTTENTPQVDENSKEAYKLLYKEKFNELVESHLVFSLFVNPKSEEEEVYDPSINMLINTENAFENLDNLPQKENTLVLDYNGNVGLEVPKRESETVFKWQIKDLLTSGDNYRFIGPSSKEEMLYLGMESKEEIHMTLTLEEGGYSLIIKDKSGKSEEIKERVAIKEPVIQITSEMTEQFDIPKVHIHIDNQTQDVAVVSIEGMMQGNLHIYNEKNEEIHRGGVRGNLIVR